MSSAARRLDTERLQLRAGEPRMAAALSDFLLRNQAHFAPWGPVQPADFASATTVARRLADDEEQREDGSALRWWLFTRGDRGLARIIGQVHFSQISRGAFQSAMLGYQIDAAWQGQGLMREALGAALAEVFGPRVRLHRVQANVRPENARSLALLERLGFEREGLAREFLFIDGAWRDHVMLGLRNPHWPPRDAP